MGLRNGLDLFFLNRLGATDVLSLDQGPPQLYPGPWWLNTQPLLSAASSDAVSWEKGVFCPVVCCPLGRPCRPVRGMPFSYSYKDNVHVAEMGKWDRPRCVDGWLFLLHLEPFPLPGGLRLEQEGAGDHPHTMLKYRMRTRALSVFWPLPVGVSVYLCE